MAETLNLPSLSAGVKRDHEGQAIDNNTSSTVGSMSSALRAGSPALSVASSSLTELSTPSAAVTPNLDPAAPPAKKLKLTFAEREVERAVRKREKEDRARLKDEEKRKKAEEREDAKRLKDVEKAEKEAEKEEAKRLKEVEKAEKEAERNEKQKVKDAEKAEKEAEKAKKEAEKLKKERVSRAFSPSTTFANRPQAQSRLGAFFVRPAQASSPPSTPDDVSAGVSSRRSSIASIDMDKPELDTKTSRPSNTDYSTWILPFFAHDDTDVAPANRFLIRRADVDEPPLHQETSQEDHQPLCQIFSRSKRRYRNVRPVKHIVAEMMGSQTAPIDLTSDGIAPEVGKALQTVSYKILSYREDIRPPYQGTFTRPVSPRAARKLSRRPTYRGLPEVDYDYDSEAEWQEPDADDEDLENDDELSEDEGEGDEMADFLDDGGEIAKRRITSADVEPVCTGICWEDQSEDVVNGIDLTLYRLDMMHDDQKFPIDPYSTQHWVLTGKNTPLKAKPEMLNRADSPAMQPPRMPLTSLAPNASPLRVMSNPTHVVDASGQKENEVPATFLKVPNKKTNKPVKTVPLEQLPAFKIAISGSDLNKVALIEILKKQFPKCSKDSIKGTLEQIAVRQGAKEVDKRWVLIA